MRIKPPSNLYFTQDCNFDCHYVWVDERGFRTQTDRRLPKEFLEFCYDPQSEPQIVTVHRLDLEGVETERFRVEIKSIFS